MKSAAILMLSLVSSTTFASTLNIPLLVEENNQVVTAKDINTKYKLQGADKIQEVISVNNTDASYKQANQTYWQLREQVEQLSTKLNSSMFVSMSIPGSVNLKAKTCYTGSPADIATIIANLTDGIYSDQLGVWGWKYKKTTTLVEAADADDADFLNSSALWANWKGQDETVLVLTHESDGGDDVNEGLIVKCK